MGKVQQFKERLDKSRVIVKERETDVIYQNIQIENLQEKIIGMDKLRQNFKQNMVDEVFRFKGNNDKYFELNTEIKDLERKGRAT